MGLGLAHPSKWGSSRSSFIDGVVGLVRSSDGGGDVISIGGSI